jgi:hypothetical protein
MLNEGAQNSIRCMRSSPIPFDERFLKLNTNAFENWKKFLQGPSENVLMSLHRRGKSDQQFLLAQSNFLLKFRCASTTPPAQYNVPTTNTRPDVYACHRAIVPNRDAGR